MGLLGELKMLSDIRRRKNITESVRCVCMCGNLDKVSEVPVSPGA